MISVSLIVECYFLLLFIFYSITIFFAIKLFSVYDWFTTLKFIIIFGSLNARSLGIAFLILNSNYNLVSQYYTLQIEQCLFFLSFLGHGGLILLFLHPIFNRNIHRYSYLALFVYGLLLGMTLGDIITANSSLFGIRIDEIGINVLVVNYYVIFLRIMGLFLLILIFITVKNHAKAYPSLLFSWNSINILFNTLIYIILSLDLFILIELFESFTIIEDLIADTFYAFLSLTIAIAVLIMFYHAYKDANLQVFWGIKPEKTLEIGFIGYLLSSMTSLGPTPLLISKKFQEVTKITEPSLLGISVNAMAIIGSFRSAADEIMKERYLLMPVPYNVFLTTLGFTFTIKDQELAKEDPRFITGSPALFAIIFPSDLTLALEHLPQALPIVLEFVSKVDNIKELQNSDLLEQLSIKILKKILE